MEHIPYTIKKIKRAKRVRLTVHYDGRVVVTAPFSFSKRAIEAFVSDKRHWLIKQLTRFRNADTSAVRVFSKDDYQKHKDEALRLVTDMALRFNKLYGFSIHTIRIKDQKTRWGSCSRKKNIQINYRVLFLPEAQRNYIIVHELCHLQELNHSPRFWRLVENAIPNFALVKKELRAEEKYFR